MSLQKINLSNNSNSMAYREFAGTISCNGSPAVPYSAIRSKDGSITFTILGEMKPIVSAAGLQTLPLVLTTTDEDLRTRWNGFDNLSSTFQPLCLVRYGSGTQSKIGSIYVVATSGLPAFISPLDGIPFNVGNYPVNTVGATFTYPAYKLNF